MDIEIQENSKLKWYLITALLFLSVLLVIWYLFNKDESSFIDVIREHDIRTIKIPGSVQFSEIALISPELSGSIKSIYSNMNSMVRKNEKIIEIDTSTQELAITTLSEELDDLEINIRKEMLDYNLQSNRNEVELLNIRYQLSHVELELSNMSSLAAIGAVSADEVVSKRNEKNKIEAEITLLHEKHNLEKELYSVRLKKIESLFASKKNKLEKLNDSIQQSILLSPEDGVIEYFIEPRLGSILKEGTPFATIRSPAFATITANIPESILSSIDLKEDDLVFTTISNREYPLRLKDFSSKVINGNLVATFYAPNSADIRQNMSLPVTIVIKRYPISPAILKSSLPGYNIGDVVSLSKDSATYKFEISAAGDNYFFISNANLPEGQYLLMANNNE